MFRRLSLFLFISWASFQALALSYQGHTVSVNQLELETEQGKIILTGLAPDVFEVNYQLEQLNQLPSYALVPQVSAPSIEIKESAKQLSVINGDLKAVIRKNPINISFYRDQELILQEEVGYFAHQALVGFRFKLQEGEKLLGGGERIVGMDRRGHRFPLYNRAHYGYGTHSEQMNYSLPAVMSSNKYLLLFDNSAKGALDIGKTETDVLQFEAIGGRTSYVVAAEESYPELIQSYTQVTGRTPLPARWTLGNFASRFGYRTEQEARETVAKFKQAGIPLDAIIFDLYWFGKDVRGHMGNLRWDKEAFPTPEKMMADFNQQGVKTIVITEPFILTSSKSWQSAVEHDALAKNLAGQPKVFDFFFGETGLVDVFDKKGTDWFWQYYQAMHEQGVTGWWGDLGEPEVHPHDTIHSVGTADEIHNAYGHMWAKMVYENHRKMAPKERPFILMRSGFAGSQRYGLIPWTGDVSRSWDGLKPQVELSLQMSLFGLAYTHSDLGGFAGDHWDKEMYIRWLQYGVFQPIYRPHAQEKVAPEPVFHDAQVQKIVGDYIRLRYRLMPYNYTLAYQNSVSGMPLMRPLFFTDEENLALIDYKDAYLWGDAFLVSPVTEPNVKSQSMLLPAGVWFDYWRGTKYQGGQPQEVPVDLNTIPVLVKAGSFVPMVDDFMTTKSYDSSRLTLHYYHDESVKEASGEMYEDDGTTFGNIANRAYELLKFKAKVSKRSLFTFSRQGFQYPAQPSSRVITLVLHNWNKPGVRLTDNKLKRVTSLQALDLAKQGVYYEAASNTTYVKFEWQQATTKLIID